MKPLLLAISFALIGSTGKIIDFDSATLGKMPPGWSAAMANGGSMPKWQVLQGWFGAHATVRFRPDERSGKPFARLPFSTA